MKKLFILLLILAVIGMGYVTTRVIMKPLNFDKVKTQRESVLEKQLKLIAKAEKAYEELNGRYATAEELKDFLQNGRVYHIKAEGDYTDAMRDKGLTEQQAAAKGLIKRDTIWTSAKSAFLKDGQSIDGLFSVLNTNNVIKIDTGSKIQVIGQDSIKIPLFQASIPYEDYLKGIDQNTLSEIIEKRKEMVNGYPGLRIGSLKEAKTTGNWE